MTIKYDDLPHYTYEDYKMWEGDWELIGGVAYAMAPSPIKIHQKLIGLIFAMMDEKFKDCNECEVLLEEDWKVSEDTVLRPDVAMVCKDENKNFIAKTPEIVVEIISPSTARKDEGLKFGLYEREKVKYYILVYPDTLVAKVYKNGERGFDKIGDFTHEIYDFEFSECQMNFDFGKLFSRFR